MLIKACRFASKVSIWGVFLFYAHSALAESSGVIEEVIVTGYHGTVLVSNRQACNNKNNSSLATTKQQSTTTRKTYEKGI